MRTFLQVTPIRSTAFVLAALGLSRVALAGQTPAESSLAAHQTVACRVLEVHSTQAPGVSVVVFHQRDESQRDQLAALLRKQSGASVQFQTRDRQWHEATVLRLKSCFGRGLLLFPTGTAQVGEKDEFLLKLSPDKGS